LVVVGVVLAALVSPDFIRYRAAELAPDPDRRRAA
jgi:hypothetical protein